MMRNQLENLIADPAVERLADVFERAGYSLYLVGGAVRDALLGLPPKDLDFTTDARPAMVEQLLLRAGSTHIGSIGKKFGTMTGQVCGKVVEITTYRSEVYEPGNRSPEVRFGDNLVEDLARRDFTINAIAVGAYDGVLIDPFRGADDVKLGDRLVLIRAVGDPDRRLQEDPLRILRAVRFYARYNGSIATNTYQAMMRNVALLASVSNERIADEFSKILVGPDASVGVSTLVNIGAMGYILPEYTPVLEANGQSQGRYHSKDIHAHTLAAVESSPATLVNRFAALLHDIGKPATRSEGPRVGEVHFIGHEVVGERITRQALRRLKFSNDFVERVSRLVGMHMRPNTYEFGWTDGAVRRFVREAGDLLPDLLILSRADITSHNSMTVGKALGRLNDLERRIDKLEEEAASVQVKSPLDGHEIMALFPDRAPGNWIGHIKDDLVGMVLDGQIQEDDKVVATKFVENCRDDAHQLSAHGTDL